MIPELRDLFEEADSFELGRSCSRGKVNNQLRLQLSWLRFQWEDDSVPKDFPALLRLTEATRITYHPIAWKVSPANTDRPLVVLNTQIEFAVSLQNNSIPNWLNTG